MFFGSVQDGHLSVRVNLVAPIIVIIWRSFSISISQALLVQTFPGKLLTSTS